MILDAWETIHLLVQSASQKASFIERVGNDPFIDCATIHSKTTTTKNNNNNNNTTKKSTKKIKIKMTSISTIESSSSSLKGNSTNVMLSMRYSPKVFEGKSEKTFYMTENVEGVRVYFDTTDMKLCTRGGKPLNCPVEWVSALSSLGVPVEGVLYIGGDSINETRKVCMKKTKAAPQAWIDRDVKFHVQDLRMDTSCEERVIELQDMDTSAVPFIVKASYTPVHSDAEVQEALVASPHGLILKKSTAKYLHRRTKHMMIARSFSKESAVISKVHEGTQKHEGKIGHLTCTLVNDTNEFRVASGFSENQRTLGHFNEGDTITIQYASTSSNGNPRFARILTSSKRSRDSDDLELPIPKKVCA